MGKEAKKTRTCRMCGELKWLSDFSARSRGSQSRRWQCKKCIVFRRSCRERGITVEQGRALGNFCHICHTTKGKLTIDHDHTTSLVRGLLCNNCNVGISMLGDNVERLQDAALYVSRGAFKWLKTS